jgi:hypothetical protein
MASSGIDMASVYAERYRRNPDVLRAAVIGQSPDSRLDPYTALNALKLVNESNRMMMAGQAQQPTSSPSLVAQNMAPQAGLGAMVPGAMGQMGQAPQGMPPQGMPPQGPAPAPQGMPPQGQAPVMQAASGGLAGMYTPEENYAAGGIVAFSEPTPENNYSLVRTKYDDSNMFSPFAKGDDDTDADADADTDYGGTPEQIGQASRNVQQSRAALLNMKDEGMSQDEFKRIRQDLLDFSQRNAGPNIYEPAEKRLSEREEEQGKNTRQGQGLALLAAAGAILEGNTLASGAAKAFPVFAQQMGEVQRASIAEKRSIESMRFSLADAQRKERMGDIRGAQAAAETARKERADANRFRLGRAQALAKLDSDVYRAVNRPNKGTGAQPSPFNVLFNAKQALAADPKNPQLQAAVKNAQEAVAATKTSFSTSEVGNVNATTKVAPVQQRVDDKVATDIADFKLFSPEGAAYRRAVKAGAEQEAARLLREAEGRFRAVHSRTEGLTGAGNKAAPGTAENPIVIK